MKYIPSLYRWMKKLNALCASISGILILFVAVAIFVDVILRYFFNKPSIWITEVSTYLFLYIIFLGTAYALQQDLHIKVEFLIGRLGSSVLRWIDLATSLLAITFCIVLVWQTAVMTWTAFTEKWIAPTALGAPYAAIYVSMVIGSILLLVTLCLRTILRIAGYNVNEEQK